MTASPPSRLPQTEGPRALAHPLRSRLLAQLRVHGGATATQLALDLDTNSGATSYHLRILEYAGLIIDSGSGVGRRRVWEAAPSPVGDEFDLGDETAAHEAVTARWLQHDLVHHAADRGDRWVDEQDNWPSSWQLACGLRDHDVLVTTEQLSALAAELTEVFARYRRIGAGSPGARRVAAYSSLLPVDKAPKSP